MTTATMTVDAVRDLRIAGQSYAEIAAAFEINKGAVYKFAKKHGLIDIKADPIAAAEKGDYSGFSDGDLKAIDEAAAKEDFAAVGAMIAVALVLYAIFGGAR